MTSDCSSLQARCLSQRLGNSSKAIFVDSWYFPPCVGFTDRGFKGALHRQLQEISVCQLNEVQLSSPELHLFPSEPFFLREFPQQWVTVEDMAHTHTDTHTYTTCQTLHKTGLSRNPSCLGHILLTAAHTWRTGAYVWWRPLSRAYLWHWPKHLGVFMVWYDWLELIWHWSCQNPATHLPSMLIPIIHSSQKSLV